jgi:hypothetical protein
MAAPRERAQELRHGPATLRIGESDWRIGGPDHVLFSRHRFTILRWLDVMTFSSA